MKNLGNYEMIYPSEDGTLMDRYAVLLEASQEMWA